jgi:hypothetical protein
MMEAVTESCEVEERKKKKWKVVAIDMTEINVSLALAALAGMPGPVYRALH